MLIASILLSSNSFANEYNWISSAHVQSYDDEFISTLLTTNYYFDGIKSQGPADYFGYNVRANHLGGRFTSVDHVIDSIDLTTLFVNGEYNIDAFQFKLDHSFTDGQFGDSSSTNFAGEYYYNDNWSFGYQGREYQYTYKNSDASSAAQSSSFFRDNVFIRYQHQFSKQQSIGTKLTEYDGSFWANVEYFTALSNDQYFKISTNVYFDEYTFNTDMEYYFDSQSAIGLELIESDIRAISYKHFYNSNIKLSATITNPFDSELFFGRTITLNVTSYF